MKNFLIGLVVFVILVIAGVFWGSKFLLAEVLGKVVGVPVRIEHIDLGAAVSQIGIYGLEIGNPEGFDEEALARIPEIYASYDIKSFFQGVPHIKEIRLNLDEVVVERNAQGKVNLMQLGAVQESEAGRQQAETAKQPSAQKDTGEAAPSKPPRVSIDLVDLTVGRARYVDYGKGEPVAREFPLGIKHVQLKNVTDPQTIVMQVVIRTLQKVGLNALMPDMDQFMAAMQGQTQAQVGSAKEAMESLAEKFKRPFGTSSTATK